MLELKEKNMSLDFSVTEAGCVALENFSLKEKKSDEKSAEHCLISEVQVIGADTNQCFGLKHKNSSEVKVLKYKSHKLYENELGKKAEILMSNERIEVTAHYQLFNGIAAVRAWKTVKNISDGEVGLEYLPSFTYTLPKTDGFNLYIPTNSWCHECDWRRYTSREIGFNIKHRISYSCNNSWSTGENLPMAAYETENEVYLWQIENNGAWQWEIGAVNDMPYIYIGGPTEQECSWYKLLKPGEVFESVKASVSLGTSFDEALDEMTEYRRRIINNNESNKKLPLIFNDYMHCIWADPTEEKMLPIIDKAAQLGCEYYCMDAGWYADDTWWNSVGLWKEKRKRFPDGIKKVFDYVKSKGMVPGIWLEIEVMGIECPILDEFDDDCFFMRHGKRVVNRGRYLLDFRNEKVRRFATETVDRVVNEYGAGYIKFDYNVTTGVGTDYNTVSFGDGLLEHNRAYLEWVRSIKRKYPELIMENCASGGMRMDYAMLAECHLQSVSDQSNYINTAYIAAAAPTAVIPEQAGIWACPVKNNTADETAYLMANAMLQRLYISGRIDMLDDENFGLVKEAADLYKRIRDEIPYSVPFYPLGLPKNESGDVVCVGFKYKNCSRIAVWNTENKSRTVKIPSVYSSAKIIYPSNSKVKMECEKESLKITFPDKLSAVIIELK